MYSPWSTNSSKHKILKYANFLAQFFLLLEVYIYRSKISFRVLISFDVGKDIILSYIFLYIQEVANVTYYAQNVYEKFTLKPFIICKGSSFNPTQSSVFIEGNLFPNKPLQESVDACFKFFYIIHHPFCYAVWKFFQSVIYKMLDGKVPSCVGKIRTYLTSRCKEWIAGKQPETILIVCVFVCLVVVVFSCLPSCWTIFVCWKYHCCFIFGNKDSKTRQRKNWSGSKVFYLRSKISWNEKWCVTLTIILQ